MRKTLSALALLALASCANPPPAEAPAPPTTSATPAAPAPAPLDREEVNRAAVRLNLPLFWTEDRDGDGEIDPDEVVRLLFYPQTEAWVEDGAFTPAFHAALDAIREAARAPLPTGEDEESVRRRLVLEDLDSGKPTLVYSDLRGMSAEQRRFVGRMLEVSALIDQIYAQQLGLPPLAAKIPADDKASQSLFRRNWGPKCVGAKTEAEPRCSAIAGAPAPRVGIYPAELQGDEGFCAALEKLPNAKELLDPFSVLRKSGAALSRVPYNEAYGPEVSKVRAALEAAALELTDPKEAALRAYLLAASSSFETNDWRPADEAWAKMNAENSAFYVRVAPDETYWEPCSHKAGFHLSFARINTDSLAWQSKLVPVQQAMEQALAKTIGAPYAPHKVSFHLPDFIDIITNAGDDRDALGATIGQSLPNWGPVANEGRGRTVAMSNLFTDADSRAARRRQAESLLVEATSAALADSPTPGLLSTILHEATHNLGPAHEYVYKNKKDTEWFGGELASMLEELKAQSGALYFIDYLRRQGIVSDELAAQTYIDSVVWGFGHIARGMRTPTGKAKPYSQLAAIQLGFLMDEGAVVFHADSAAANGADKGAFEIVMAKMPAAADKLMAKVGAIKARGDRAGAEALVQKYVDGPTVPQAVIAERLTRYPKQSLVYAVDL